MISRVIIGALLVVSTTAQLDSVFSVDELLKIDQNHVSRVQDAHKDGLKAAYHASRLVAWKPSAYGSSTKAAFCSSVTDQLKTASKLTDASYGIQALATLGCKQPKIAASAVDLVKEAITSKSLTKLYAAVSAADALDTLGQGITVDYSSVVKTVTKLQQSDGKFKQSSSKSSSALYAGMAYHVLAIAFPHVKREQAAVSSISRVVEKIDSLLAAAEGSEASDLSLGTTDRLATTSIVISGALRLATVSSDEIAVTLEQLTAFGSFLISHVTVPDVSTLFYVLNGLEGLNNSSVGKVVALQLTNARLSNTKGGKGDQLQVFLSEVFGAPVNGATIVLKSAIDASSGDELPSMNDQALHGDGKGVYSLDFLSGNPAPAVYQLIFQVQSGAFESPEEGVVRLIHITAAAKLGKATVYVSNKAGDKASEMTRTAEYPKSFASGLKARQGQYVHVEFPIVAAAHGAPLRPHQVFVQLVNKETSTRTTFVVHAMGDASGTHKVSLDMSNRDALYAAAAAGTYDIEVLIGDVTLHQPFLWSLGSIQFNLPQPVAQDEILYTKALLHESDTTLKPLKEICHQFRAPEPRPPVVVSLSFAAAVAAPMAIFVIGAFAIGGNFSAFPIGLASLYALVFHGALGCSLALYFFYWVQLSMLQVLPILAVLGVVMFFSGNRLFRALVVKEAGEE